MCRKKPQQISLATTLWTGPLPQAHLREAEGGQRAWTLETWLLCPDLLQGLDQLSLAVICSGEKTVEEQRIWY